MRLTPALSTAVIHGFSSLRRVIVNAYKTCVVMLFVFFYLLKKDSLKVALIFVVNIIFDVGI